MKKFLLLSSLVFILIAGFHGCKSAEETGGNIHLKQGRYDRAIEQYEEALANSPGNAGLHVSLATAYYMKKEYKTAVDHLDKAMELDKALAENQIESYEDLVGTKYLKWQIYYNGAVEYSKDNLEKGLELGKKALEVEDSVKVSQTYSLLASFMLNEGKIDEANEFLAKAVEADEKNVEAYMTQGHIYLTQRETGKALESFKEVLKIDSSKVKVYELMGQAYLLEDKHEEAIKSLEKALSITGKDPVLLYNLMLAHFEAENYDKAISEGEEVLGLKEVEPKVLTNVYNLMGQIYQEKEEYKKVVAVIKEAIDKGVNNCDSYSLIAHAYFKLGDRETSSKWSEKWEECEGK